MTIDLVTQKIISAYQTLLSRDSYLFAVGANERSMTHKLAEYLQAEFPEWNVDCEYNKNQYDEKVLTTWEERRDELISTLETEITERRRNLILKILDGGVSVYPDIIIHHRGTNDNLAVLEAKKTDFPEADDHDEEKLLAYLTEPGLKYKSAYKVMFPSGENALKNFDITNGVKQIFV